MEKFYKAIVVCFAVLIVTGYSMPRAGWVAPKPAFDALRYPEHKEIASENARSEPKPLVMTPELERVLSEFREATMQPTVTLRLARRETSVYSSKLGGVPYLPPGFAYPRRGNRPLWLLAQLNMEELPPLPGFPQTGMLQFYIDADIPYGADDTDPTRPAGFRVVYHERLETDPARLQAPPPMPSSWDIRPIPVDGEFALDAELTEMPMSYGDFRFEPTFLEIYRRHISTDVKQVYDLGAGIYDLFPGEGHRMGGYPHFAQVDPREWNERYKDYTILLLQVDSEWVETDYGIIWGDVGTGGFYITPRQLAERDFSKVLYTWDCY